jgi:hypothetical protein
VPARRTLVSSFSTGPPHWNEIATQELGMPSKNKNSDMFHFRIVSFYSSLKRKVGLAAAEAASLCGFGGQGC